MSEESKSRHDWIHIKFKGQSISTPFPRGEYSLKEMFQVVMDRSHDYEKRLDVEGAEVGKGFSVVVEYKGKKQSYHFLPTSSVTEILRQALELAESLFKDEPQVAIKKTPVPEQEKEELTFKEAINKRKTSRIMLNMFLETIRSGHLDESHQTAINFLNRSISEISRQEVNNKEDAMVKDTLVTILEDFSNIMIREFVEVLKEHLEEDDEEDCDCSCDCETPRFKTSWKIGPNGICVVLEDE